MKNIFRLIIGKLVSLVNVREHVYYNNADNSIRNNIAFKGPNVIILACAIVIASVGLNVNSIPVIIGAMLISPVMGPILGFGLGLGTADNKLMRDSLKNFLVMVSISIIASFLYFRLSPLRLENQTELLARTNPSIYDVLIALFGGFAGILETSRKEKGTVIAGVAIATALMPPLCTVGYGFSILEWKFIGGALYLFLINSIFIALSTFIAVKLFKFPKVETAGGAKNKKSTRWTVLILIVIIVPSIFSAVNMVRENNFKMNVSQLVKKNEMMGTSFIVKHEIDYHGKDSKIKLVVAGSQDTLSLERLYKDAEELGIMRNQIVIEGNYSKIEDAQKALIENQGNWLADKNREIEKLGKDLEKLEDRNATLTLRNDELNTKNEELNERLSQYDESIPEEMFILYPYITNVSITRGQSVDAHTEKKVEQIVAHITSDEPISAAVQGQIEHWLKVRLNIDNVLIVVEAPYYEQ